MKVLGIAFEPWETEIVAAVNAQLSELSCCDESCIFIADFYQLHRHLPSENLARIAQEYEQKLYTLQDEFYKWQEYKDSLISYDSEILRWAQKHNLKSSTRVLEFSDHIFSCFERTPYYRPMTQKAKSAVFYYYAIKIEEVLEEFKPDLVWCIERNYLAKNIFAALCDSRKIPMQTLINSRLSNYWYFSDSFVFPFGDERMEQEETKVQSGLSDVQYSNADAQAVLAKVFLRQ